MSATAASDPAVRYIVGGRVQGVGFRAATVQTAAALGVRGFARNLADGSVEVVAAGAPDALAALASWLWQGPPAARVVAVTVEEWSGHVPEGFGIRRA